MSQISSNHLQELTDQANQRLLEFGAGKFQPLPVGLVRLLHDVIKQWYEEKEEAWAMQRISDVTITAQMAMKLQEQGYQRGKADAAPIANGAPTAPPITDADRAWATRTAQSLGVCDTSEDAKDIAIERRRENRPDPDANGLPAPPIEARPTGGVMMEFSATRIVPRGIAIVQRRTLAEVDAQAAHAPRELAEVDAQAAHAPRELDDVDSDEDALDIEELTTRADRMAHRLTADDKADMLREVLHTLQEMAVDGVMPSRTTWDVTKPPGMAHSQTLLKRHDLSWRSLAQYARLSYRGGAVSDDAGE